MAFKLDEKYLIDAEKQLGAKLPESYRQTMMIKNGGEISTANDEWYLHPIFDTTDRKKIARTCNHIIKETESMSNWRGWPSNALSIAQNDSGDALVFLQKGTVFSPEVYVWNHETGVLQKIANSFGSLT